MALADLEVAARLDAQGRHADAIQRLSLAAQAGDAEALASLGLRLLEGLNAPYLPQQGAGLLSDAARRGHAKAAALVSVLAGGGFHGPQSWTAALDFLQRSAELDDASARTQLELLTGLTGTPGRLREQVDIGAWTCAPPAKPILKSPAIHAVEQLVPAPICDWLVELSRPRLERALVQDPRTGLTIMGKTRTNQVASFTLRDTSLIHLLIQARIAAAAPTLPRMLEAFAVLHYAVGEQASEHFDYLDPDNASYAATIAAHGQRVATCLLYLNDDYEAGETVFPALGIKHRGRKGDALIFRSVDASAVPDPRTLHAGRPPTRGEKWVLSQFIRDRPMTPGSAPS